MCKYAIITMAFVLCFSAVVFGQTGDGQFQVRFATNIKKQDVINIANTGASNATICANVYGLATNGVMLACCSCPVAPNNLVSLSLRNDLPENVLPHPKAMVLKIISSTGVGANCNGATIAAGGGNNVLVAGMGAWKGEAAFTPSSLSAGELGSLTTACGVLHPTQNLCAVCRL